VYARDGRVAVSGDSDFICDSFDWDSDGTNDYFEYENRDLALNTIRWLSAAGLIERVVLFDESNNPYYTISGFWSLAELGRYLTANGYTIKWMTTFYTSLLAQAHALVIGDNSIATAYSTAEEVAITQFVQEGGGLMILADNGAWNDHMDPIANIFGLDYNESVIHESDDYIGSTTYPIFDGANIGTHPVTQGVKRIELDLNTGFHSIGTGTSLVKTDDDGTATWGGIYPAINVSVIAATENALGRVIAFADLNYFDNTLDFDSDGDTNFYDSDNNLLTVNAFQWLTENRAPVVTLVYPNGGESLSGSGIGISWSATDPNKDIIMYDLEYSTDNGGTWNPLVAGLMTTTWNWDTTAHPDSDQFLIRVIAYDYELGSTDDSDAVFTVDNNGPTITNLQHAPTSPTPSDTITISADITDISGLSAITLVYNVNAGPDQTVTMTLQAGDTYAADIGPFADGDAIDYHVEATDNSPSTFATTSATQSFTVTQPTTPTPTPTTPPIPGFPLEALVIGLALSLGLIVVLRRRKK
jgi:hypothetical protein